MHFEIVLSINPENHYVRMEVIKEEVSVYVDMDIPFVYRLVKSLTLAALKTYSAVTVRHPRN